MACITRLIEEELYELIFNYHTEKKLTYSQLKTIRLVGEAVSSLLDKHNFNEHKHIERAEIELKECVNMFMEEFHSIYSYHLIEDSIYNAGHKLNKLINTIKLKQWKCSSGEK